MTGAGPPRAGPVLGLLCLAQFLVVLDTTIVNVALPSLGADLAFSEGALQYVLSLYALTFGGLLVVAGRASDSIGRRRTFIAGLVLFTLSSLACGAAPDAATLLTARTVQGVGSALVSAAALALLTSLFPAGGERNRALGVWGAVGGAAGACGLLLGGVLTEAFGWPAIFLINVPLGAIAACVAPRLLPSGAAEHRVASLDLPGAVAVTSGLGSLLFALDRARYDGFTATSTLGASAGSLLSLAVFVAIERRSSEPLVSPRVVRSPEVAIADCAMLVLTMFLASNLFFTTLYVQNVLELSPLWTGIAFVPNSALVVAGSALATRLGSRTGPAPLLAAGFALLLAAGLLLSAVPENGSFLLHVLPGFGIVGLGQGMAFVAATICGTRVAEEDHGLASGMLNSAQQLGFAIGLATVLGASALLAGADAAPVATYVIGYRLDAVLAALGLLLTWALSRFAGRADTPTTHARSDRIPERED